MNRSMLLGAAAALLLCGCGDTSRTADPSSQRTSSTLAWGAERTLEENDSSLLVAPRVTAEDDGFLVADFRENQARRYDRAGRLVWSAGRKGDGPGEYQSPAGIARLVDGDIVVTDFRSRLVRYTPDGQVRKASTLPMSMIGDPVPLDGSRILITGVGDSSTTAHIWNLNADTVEKSFFIGVDHVVNRRFAQQANYILIAARADTLAIAYSISDSIYFYTAQGERVRAMRIPADSFRVVEAELPADRLNSDMAFRKQWFQSFDVVRYIGWLSDGTLVLKYSTIGAPSTDSTFLVHMTADGRRLLETRTPGLMAIDRTTDSLYFVAPGADAPNRWIAAKLKYE